jgi:hypothetical protein
MLSKFKILKDYAKEDLRRENGTVTYCYLHPGDATTLKSLGQSDLLPSLFIPTRRYSHWNVYELYRVILVWYSFVPESSRHLRRSCEPSSVAGIYYL